jgi:type II secretory pathway pseudopilin PulG
MRCRLPHIPAAPVRDTRVTGALRRGFVLVAVLVLVLLVSMVAASLLFRLRAVEAAASASLGAEQGWAAAVSGIQEAMRQARMPPAAIPPWYDNPRAFRDRFVFDDGSDRWFFTVYSAADGELTRDVRYGLTDEAGKVNLNAAHSADLEKLPGLTPPLVQSLRDFIDPDTTARPEGAEQEYYDTLPRRYAVRNGPLATLDELLLVRGFTPSVLYGEDLNMNFRLDPNEDDGDQTPPRDNNDGRLDLGLRRHFTVSAYDVNEDNGGVRRTNLNDPNDPLPAVPLPPALTNFVTAMRAARVAVAHPADLLEASIKIKDERGRDVEVVSGVGKAELPLVLDHFTASRERREEGLINVNTASIEVLSTVPEIDPPLAEAIVSARKGVAPERRATLAWLYQDDVVDAARFRQIAPHLTARGRQFSFHVVGYGVPSGRFRALDVVIDTVPERPVVSYLRDLTRLGPPFRFQDAATKEDSGG